MKSERRLARLTVAADAALVTPVRDFVNRVLARHGLPEDQLLRLDLLVEEACLHVVQNNFDPDEGGEYEVTVLRRPNQLVIALEDRGLPGDVAEAERREEAQLGLALMRAFADEVIFRNLGKNGRRIELVKSLTAAALPDPEQPPAIVADHPPVATDAVTLRLMTADDAMDLARCIYRAYGYTYGADFVYFPDKVAELLAGGRLASCVAVNEDGEVVGHIGLQFAGERARVADSGVAVVDPRYRGRKLFERMKTFMAEWAGRNGVLGLASEAVAVHPITQKGNLNLGAGETGVLPGYLPVGLEFRNITGGASAQRQTAVMYYLKTNEGPVRDVYPPARHSEMIGRIYDNAGLKRRLVAPPSGVGLEAVGDRRSVLELRLKPDVGRAFLKIGEYGGDALELVHRNLRELRLRKLDCIFLDLPLREPLTAALCRAFEDMGFSFVGVGVETDDGDALRLLHLNNVDIDREGLVIVSGHGRALADYVLAALDEAGRLRSA